MSREIENLTASFRKARKEGAVMLEDGRISWEDYAFIMIGFEESIKQAGGEL